MIIIVTINTFLQEKQILQGFPSKGIEIHKISISAIIFEIISLYAFSPAQYLFNVIVVRFIYYLFFISSGSSSEFKLQSNAGMSIINDECINQMLASFTFDTCSNIIYFLFILCEPNMYKMSINFKIQPTRNIFSQRYFWDQCCYFSFSVWKWKCWE